jgi:hypothetical protein
MFFLEKLEKKPLGSTLDSMYRLANSLSFVPVVQWKKQTLTALTDTCEFSTYTPPLLHFFWYIPGDQLLRSVKLVPHQDHLCRSILRNQRATSLFIYVASIYFVICLRYELFKARYPPNSALLFTSRWKIARFGVKVHMLIWVYIYMFLQTLRRHVDQISTRVEAEKSVICRTKGF